MDSRGKKKKKQKRSDSYWSEESSDKVSASSTKSGKGLSWGAVEEIHFSRSLGACVVPHRGNFPLGLGEEVGRNVVTVDNHVRLKQAELIDRMNSKGLSVSISPISVSTEHLTISDFNLETRQYDYKPNSIVNPLFHPVAEEHRRVILCQEVISKSNRPRSDSQSSLSGKTDVSSSSISESELNRELDIIRVSRGQSGCNCKPLKVDKLSFGKIKSLLTARGHEVGLDPSAVNSLNKSDASDWMRKIIKITPICLPGSCSCNSGEVECSAELCGCLRRIGSSGTRCNRSDSVDSETENSVSDNRCGNSFGQVIFDPDVVDNYRKSILQHLGPIKSGSIETGLEKMKIGQNLDIPPIPKASEAK